MLVPDLRPLSVGEIIDVAIKIWRRHFGTLARIVFVVVAPVEIVSTLIAASVSGFEERAGFETFDPATGDPTIDGGALAAWLAGMFTAQVLSGLAFLISSAAVLRAVSVAYLGGTPDWRESLRAATARLGPLIWLGFLMFAGLTLAFLALIGPGIWLGVAWAVAFPVLIAEGQRGARALGRSFRLVQGRWWPTFGALFLAFLLQAFIGVVLGVPLGLVTITTDSNSLPAILFTMVVSVVSSVITTPFMAAVLVLIYFDLRVRKEGFDLQLLSQGVGIPGHASPADAPWLAGAGGPGGHWGGAGGQWGSAGNWPAPGGNWPPPSGDPVAPGYGSPSPGGSVPASDPPTGPPPATRFDEPIDPTGPTEAWPPPPRRSEDLIDPTGPGDAWPPPPRRTDEPTDPTGPREQWPPPPARSEEPKDPTGSVDETSSPPGDQPEQ